MADHHFIQADKKPRLLNVIVPLIILLLMLSPLIYLFYVKTYRILVPCLVVEDCSNDDVLSLYVGIIWLSLLSIACTGGAIGTLVSFFLRKNNVSTTQNNQITRGKGGEIDELVQIGPRDIFALMGFGSVFGLLMLALFIGEFVQGNLFPNIQGTSWIDIGLSASDWAKTFIWCFIAGFSERIIPDFLNNLVLQFHLKKAGGLNTVDLVGQDDDFDNGHSK